MLDEPNPVAQQKRYRTFKFLKRFNMVCKWLTVMSKQLKNVYKYQHYCFHFLITNLMQMWQRSQHTGAQFTKITASHSVWSCVSQDYRKQTNYAELNLDFRCMETNNKNRNHPLSQKCYKCRCNRTSIQPKKENVAESVT